MPPKDADESSLSLASVAYHLQAEFDKCVFKESEDTDFTLPGVEMQKPCPRAECRGKSECASRRSNVFSETNEVSLVESNTL